MALGLRRPAERPTALDPEEVAFSQLFGTLAANPSVQIIAVDDLNRYIDLWIRMGDDDEANEMAVYDAISEYHNSEGVTTPIDEHLLLAHEPDSYFPKNLPVMFRRRS
ncbi:MAG TPA: hypothetical protein VFH48_43595 [Chloroflexota bacterium]|nr:hypothetical protein [Chloroflexota bacterium]